MCFLTSLPKILIFVGLIRSAVFAQPTGADIYETAWEFSSSINNYDVIFVDWKGRIPKKRMRIRCVFWGQVARVVEFSFLILMFSGGQSQPS